jgi:hypothetical protein
VPGLLLVVSLLGGCSSSSNTDGGGGGTATTGTGTGGTTTGGGGGGSCLVSSLGYCIDYIGSNWSAVAVQSDCNLMHGVYSSSDCAPGNSGTCDIGGGTAVEIKWVFISGISSSDAQLACGHGDGVYTPP